MKQIIKLCADSVRNSSAKHNVKLKASHAHELVAAFFGYQSKAALLADTQHSLSNLRQASIIILLPTASIEERRKKLQDLPSELPDNYTFGEWIYLPLLAEKWITYIPWPHYERLATFLADGYLQKNQLKRVYNSPIKQKVTNEITHDGLFLTVFRLYQIPTQTILIPGTIQETSITTTIQLQRVAGYIGYSEPKISVQIDRSEQLI